MIKISKRVGISKKERIKYRGGVFFYQSKLMSHFVPVFPVSPHTTLKERIKDKGNDCLVVLNNIT